jgi:hypothetical protein
MRLKVSGLWIPLSLLGDFGFSRAIVAGIDAGAREVINRKN